MKICVIGAGAIGGMMGTKLALSGHDVSVVDQGQNLKAIQENGLKLIWEDGTEYQTDVAVATDKVADVGEQDLIILGLKAHYLEQVAKACGILKTDTVRDIEALQGAFLTALGERGPWLIVAKVEEREYLPVAPVEPELTLYRLRNSFG